MALSDLVYRTRSELGDLPTSFEETVVGTGDTTRYIINRAPMSAPTVTVIVDSVDVTERPSPNGVQVEESTGTLIFDFIPIEGALITCSGMSYRFFTDDEMNQICTDAVEMHVRGRQTYNGSPMTLANLPTNEYYVVSLLAAANALYVLATDGAFDIDIQAPDGLTIPRAQRFAHLMGLVEALQQRYRELCQMMGIGLYAIEVFTLRRISKRTNRYVPVYLPQEIDDRSRPERAELPLPTYGASRVDDGIPDLDLVINQGDTFTQSVTVATEIPEDAVLKSQVRSYPGSPVVLAEFGLSRLSATEVVLWLSHTDTENLPLNCHWDLQMIVPAETDQEFLPTDFLNEDLVQTLLRGRVRVPREVTVTYQSGA